jgi:DNA-binding XRE family transcriptional regulator
MNLQIIKAINGNPEYVLLPIKIYESLRKEINQKLKKSALENDYVPFDPSDYIDNPIALARIKAGITQEELAIRMKVSQAYISKIEKQNTVTPKLLHKIKTALINSSR